MNGIGQNIPMEQTMVVIIDREGQAHGWNVTNGTAKWTFTDIGETGRSRAHIEINGELHRRTKQLPESVLKELRN